MASLYLNAAFRRLPVMIAKSFSIVKNVLNYAPCKSVCKSFHLINFSVGNNFKYNFHMRYLLYSGLLVSLKEMFGMKEKDPDEAIIINIKRAVIALQEERFDAAEQLLHLSLKTAQEMQNQQAIVYIYDMLANVAFQRHEFDKAEKLFKEVMQRLLSTGTAQDDNAIVEISLKLTKIYTDKNKHNLALEGYRFCCDTQRQKIEAMGYENVDEDTLALWGMSVDWYAHYLLLRKDFKGAREQFQQAYDISTKVNGSDHPQTLVLLNDLGSVCSLMKDYNSAVTHLQLAINIAEETKSEDLSGFYCNLATVYMEKGIFEEALSNCQKALNVARNLQISEAENQALECIEEVRKAGF